MWVERIVSEGEGVLEGLEVLDEDEGEDEDDIDVVTLHEGWSPRDAAYASLEWIRLVTATVYN